VAIQTFDPKKLSVTVGSFIIHGWADGEMISVERTDQAFSKKTGVDGETTRVKTNNTTGQIKIKLMQSSSSNDDLSSLATADELSNSGVVPFSCKDGSGTTVLGAASVWVQKLPAAEFGKDIGVREWILDTAQLTMVVGGNFSQ
jgi:hypothetical protein